MKLKITETDYWTDIQLSPETIQEAALLLRLTQNSLLERPEIFLSFSPHNTDKSIYCNISMKKKKPNNQINSIRNKK